MGRRLLCASFWCNFCLFSKSAPCFVSSLSINLSFCHVNASHMSLQASSIRSRCRHRPAWTRGRPRGARARPRLPALGSCPGWELSDVSVNVNKSSEDMDRSLLNVCCVFQWRRVMAVRRGVAALCVKRKTWRPIRRKDAPGAQAPPIRKREWAARKSTSTVLLKVKDILWLW